MLRTLMENDDLQPLLERLARLNPEARAAWGTLDVHRMLCHRGDALRVALGDLPMVPRHSWLSRSVGRLLVVHTGLRPPRGKVHTAPEMLTSTPSDWRDDLDACRQLATRVAAGSASAVHPTFGPLTPEEWAQLNWKHIDQHLRQFGA